MNWDPYAVAVQELPDLPMSVLGKAHRYAAARRRTSFSCSRSLIRLFASRSAPLLEEAYDVDAHLEHMKYFDDMVDRDQTVYALDEEVPI